MRGSLVIALMLLPGLAPAAGEALTAVREQHYAVHGQAIREIQASMLNSAPVSQDANRYSGKASSAYSADIQMRPLPGGGCVMENAQVRLESVVTLPQLMPAARSVAVDAEWQRFYAALRAHEYQHVQNGQAVARAVQHWLNSVESRLPCEQALSRVKSAVQAAFMQLDEHEKEVDRLSGHGEAQGVALDLRVR